ncbi:uncharacterized protein Camp [Fopius arisanus]|uniref:Uncharacterized protein Camp n=1 Tax=Fopius arisanus TaxID=64838 RepID=A0A9R1TM83_9HYME|nr:PREDICTED: uncharacterized protein LOC105271921 [Fopius arisanus]
MSRRRLKKYAVPTQHLPVCDAQDQQNQENLKEAYISPSLRGSTSPFQRIATLEENINITPVANESRSPGRRGNTSKFEVTETDGGKHAVKCDLYSLFDAVEAVVCDNEICRQMLSPQGPLEGTITDHLYADENDPPNSDASVQVSAEDLASFWRKKSVDVGIQVKSGDFYEPFSTRISTDHDLSVLCGIRNHRILDKLVQLIMRFFPEKRPHKMPLRDRIILTTMKLKNDLTFSFLTIIMRCVAESTCRAIFLDTLQKLSTILRCVIRWVPKEEITRNMPLAFENFENTVCVVDCTEFKIQKPKCLACRLKIYSQYKSNFTAKFMTVVSPAGLLIYLSEGYGGRSSDGAIFEASNITSRLQPGDAVMADKGFRIENLCDKFGIQLYRSAFLERKKQFSTEEAILNRNIAAARVHVERMNQRIEIFDVLKNELSWNLVNYVNDIVIVCAGLANLGTPLFADDKLM